MAEKDKPLIGKDKKQMTYGDKRRVEKKAALRDFVKGQQLVIAINNDLEREILPDELQVVKFKTETRLKLLNKVLPDLKAIELSGDEDSPVRIVAEWMK